MLSHYPMRFFSVSRMSGLVRAFFFACAFSFTVPALAAADASITKQEWAALRQQSQELRAADDALNATWRKLMQSRQGVQKKELLTEQRRWLQERNRQALGKHKKNSPEYIQELATLTHERNAALQTYTVAWLEPRSRQSHPPRGQESQRNFPGNNNAPDMFEPAERQQIQKPASLPAEPKVAPKRVQEPPKAVPPSRKPGTPLRLRDYPVGTNGVTKEEKLHGPIGSAFAPVAENGDPLPPLMPVLSNYQVQ